MSIFGYCYHTVGSLRFDLSKGELEKVGITLCCKNLNTTPASYMVK